MEKIASADAFLSALASALDGLPRKRRALVAVSGGRDSVALVHGLYALGWKNLVVVHLDHRLRGRASAVDAKFVVRLSVSLGFGCELGRADVRSYAKERSLSIELAARELRHVFFSAVARRTRARTIFLAHHAEDQVETCLFNFLRGSGAAGLAGMRSKSSQILAGQPLTVLRPMLAIRRREVDAFLAKRNIRWREDATNASAAHTRNRLRARVLPLLGEEFGPAFPEAILRAAEILAAENDWMQGEVEKFGVTEDLAVRPLQAVSLALRRRVVRAWLGKCGVAEAGFAEVERVLTLLDVETGPRKVNLPGGRHVRRRAGKIFIE